MAFYFSIMQEMLETNPALEAHATPAGGNEPHNIGHDGVDAGAWEDRANFPGMNDGIGTLRQDANTDVRIPCLCKLYLNYYRWE